MIPAETIAELKVSHVDAWQQKRTAGLTEQQTAQVILAQIEHDQEHPPHLEAVAAAKKLVLLVNAKGAEFESLKAEVIARMKALGEHASLVDVEFISAPATDTTDVSALNKLLDEHRELLARNAERITELEAEVDLKAERILRLEDLNREAATTIGEGIELHSRVAAENERLQADLKAAQAALEAAASKRKK